MVNKFHKEVNEGRSDRFYSVLYKTLDVSHKPAESFGKISQISFNSYSPKNTDKKIVNYSFELNDKFLNELSYVLVNSIDIKEINNFISNTLSVFISSTSLESDVFNALKIFFDYKYKKKIIEKTEFNNIKSFLKNNKGITTGEVLTLIKKVYRDNCYKDTIISLNNMLESYQPSTKSYSKSSVSYKVVELKSIFIQYFNASTTEKAEDFFDNIIKKELLKNVFFNMENLIKMGFFDGLNILDFLRDGFVNKVKDLEDEFKKYILNLETTVISSSSSSKINKIDDLKRIIRAKYTNKDISDNAIKEFILYKEYQFIREWLHNTVSVMGGKVGVENFMNVIFDKKGLHVQNVFCNKIDNFFSSKNIISGNKSDIYNKMILMKYQLLNFNDVLYSINVDKKVKLSDLGDFINDFREGLANKKIDEIIILHTFKSALSTLFKNPKIENMIIISIFLEISLNKMLVPTNILKSFDLIIDSNKYEITYNFYSNKLELVNIRK